MDQVFHPRTFGLLIAGYGVISIVFPRLFFFLDEGWKFENVEPSALFILMTRLHGVLAIVFGVALLSGAISGRTGAQPVSQAPDPSLSVDTVKNGP